MKKSIWIEGRKYYYKNTYTSFTLTLKAAHREKQKGHRYVIVKGEQGKFNLYIHGIITL